MDVSTANGQVYGCYYNAALTELLFSNTISEATENITSLCRSSAMSKN